MASNIEDRPMDFDFNVMIKQAQEWIDKGTEVFQRYSCAQCGLRNTAVDPNVFSALGVCCKCQHVTDISKQGCNFLIRMTLEIGERDAARQGNGHDRDADQDRGGIEPG